MQRERIIDALSEVAREFYDENPALDEVTPDLPEAVTDLVYGRMADKMLALFGWTEERRGDYAEGYEFAHREAHDRPHVTDGGECWCDPKVIHVEGAEDGG